MANEYARPPDRGAAALRLAEHRKRKVERAKGVRQRTEGRAARGIANDDAEIDIAAAKDDLTRCDAAANEDRFDDLFASQDGGDGTGRLQVNPRCQRPLLLLLAGEGPDPIHPHITLYRRPSPRLNQLHLWAARLGNNTQVMVGMAESERRERVFFANVCVPLGGCRRWTV